MRLKGVLPGMMRVNSCVADDERFWDGNSRIMSPKSELSMQLLFVTRIKGATAMTEFPFVRLDSFVQFTTCGLDNLFFRDFLLGEFEHGCGSSSSVLRD